MRTWLHNRAGTRLNAAGVCRFLRRAPSGPTGRVLTVGEGIEDAHARVEVLRVPSHHGGPVLDGTTRTLRKRLLPSTSSKLARTLILPLGLRTSDTTFVSSSYFKARSPEPVQGSGRVQAPRGRAPTAETP